MGGGREGSESGAKLERTVTDDESDEVQYPYSLFHGTFACAAMYMSGPAGGGSAPLKFLHSKYVLYGTFVWARRALNSRKWRFTARAVRCC